MEITVSTGSFAGLPLAAAFDGAQRAGAAGVELVLTPRLVAAGPARARALERRSGVPIRSVHSVMRLRRVGPRRLADDILASAEFARGLSHCHVLVVHAPAAADLHTADARRWLDALERAEATLADTRVILTVENSGRLRESDPTSFLDHPDRLRWFAEEWGLGITFDTAHAASRDWDVVSSAASLLPLFRNIHLSDAGERTHTLGIANAFLRDHRLPGTGVLPLDALVRLLARAGYGGLVTLELSPLALRVPWRRGAERRLRETVATLRATTEQDLPSAARSREHHRRP